VADVSGALSDVSLNTKLPYLIPHLPVLQTADCRLQEGGGILCPPERLPTPTVQGPFAFSLKRGSWHSSSILWRSLRYCTPPLAAWDFRYILPPNQRFAHYERICEVHDLRSNQAIKQSTVCAAKLTSERRNLRLIVLFGPTHDTVLKIERNQLP
jgi:hypothetical protein